MSAPTYLVTGATGKIGRAAVGELLRRELPVRAVVRVADSRAEALRRAGADVIVADLFDVNQLARALRGVQRALYVPPWHPQLLHSVAAFAAAAGAERVEAVASLSQWLASPQHPALATRQSHLMEALFAQVPGAAHIVVNPGFFADNYLRLIDLAAHLGLFPLPLAESRNAPPSNEDIAAVAVATLVDPERYAGASFRPTGPELLNGREMAAIVGRVLGRTVRFVDLPMPMFRQALRALRLSEFEQAMLGHYIEEHQRGTFEIGAPTDHVRALTGRKAEDFEVIVGRYAAAPSAQRTVANTARALSTMLRIGLTPPPRPAGIAARQVHPPLGQSVLAVDSSWWRERHIGATAQPR